MIPPEDLFAPPADGPALDGDLAGLLDEVLEQLCRYVAFPSAAAAAAVTLWAVHTHVLEAFDSTPRLVLSSPEKGSGKTRVLEVLEHFVPRAMFAVNCSVAALFRGVAMGKATLLFDEADTYFGPRVAQYHEELRGLVNAGHRKGALAYRCQGEGSRQQVVAFPAYAAVALAGLGDLPDTILDRAVLVQMRRRAPGECIVPFRYRRAAAELGALRELLAVWADKARDTLAEGEPEMPSGITDRAADVWEPLLRVADAAGAPWSERARRAAVELNAARVGEDPSFGVRLLRDVRTVFDEECTDRLPTKRLLQRLNALDEAPWSSLGRSRDQKLDPRGLAERLRGFRIRPQQIRFPDGGAKGYERDAFVDAWTRYLPLSGGEGAETAETGATPQVRGPLHVSDGVSDSDPRAETPEEALTSTCFVVSAVSANSTGRKGSALGDELLPCTACGETTFVLVDGEPLCGTCRDRALGIAPPEEPKVDLDDLPILDEDDEETIVRGQYQVADDCAELGPWWTDEG